MSRQAQTITIIIADDQQFFIDGMNAAFKNYPELLLIGQAINGQELIKLTRELKPDVIISDTKMLEYDGVSTAGYFRKEFPTTGIIFLSATDEDRTIAEVLSSGANGYLLKSTTCQEILTAIKTVNMGKPYYCQGTSKKLAEMIGKSFIPKLDESRRIIFSEKDHEIIKLICKGYSNKQIAHELNVTKKSIDSHKERLMNKIDVNTTLGIVIYAVRHKMFDRVFEYSTY